MRTWESPVTLACNTASSKNLHSFIAILFLIVITGLSPVTISQVLPNSDTDCLLKFKATLTNGSSFSTWDPTSSPCQENQANWYGVLCFGNNVWGLQLEGLGLTGNLNLQPLVPMKNLRTISFMNNNFNGPMPSIKGLGALKSLYLSNNRLSGEIPAEAFAGMDRLKKILLANNAFRGIIPSSLATLPMLLEVRLNGNQFQGQIPDFKQRDLKLASFENNDLDGPIPESLRYMDPGSFAGNKDLCDPPLDACSSFLPSPPPPPPLPPASPPPEPSRGNKNGSFYTIAIILLIIGIILIIIALVICIIQTRRRTSSSRQDRTESYNYHQPIVKQNSPAESVVNHRKRRSSAGNPGRLLFVRDDVQRFDLQDLLKASAEVLGSGTFGASYKAAISSGQTLVVKRYKHMNNVGREEFHEHMRRLGSLNHPNLLPLVAYYYRKEEKLFVTEFMSNSSLASHLHANRSVNQPGLDWITRLKIIKGVARGLAYLSHELPTLTIPHGHLKSSNVVLDDSFEPLLTDYALRPVMNSDHAHNLMTAYKSPEYSVTKGQNISRKTDVWCFGVLILEVLTGRFPENYIAQSYDSNMSIVTWVSDKVKEKKTSEVFDKEMNGQKNCKGEMINLLKIGLKCCEEDEERRVDMEEVVELIEKLREGEFDDDFGSSIDGGNSNLYASRLIDDDDDFGFSMNR